MPLRTHKGVLAGTERMGGRTLGQAAKRIRNDMQPLIDAMRSAKSFKDMKRRLGKKVLTRMGTEAQTEALANAAAQAAIIAVAAATPNSTIKRRE